MKIKLRMKNTTKRQASGSSGGGSSNTSDWDSGTEESFFSEEGNDYPFEI